MPMTSNTEELLKYVGLTLEDLPKPTKNTLQQAARSIKDHLAFSTFSILLKEPFPITLDPEQASSDILARGFGSCYENHLVTKLILETLGFEVDFYNAKVEHVNATPCPFPIASHTALIVTLDGEKWLFDVAWPPLHLCQPIAKDEFNAESQQDFWVGQQGNFVQVKLQIENQWHTQYAFDITKPALQHADPNPKATLEKTTTECFNFTSGPQYPLQGIFNITTGTIGENQKVLSIAFNSTGEIEKKFTSNGQLQVEKNSLEARGVEALLLEEFKLDSTIVATIKQNLDKLNNAALKEVVQSHWQGKQQQQQKKSTAKWGLFKSQPAQVAPTETSTSKEEQSSIPEPGSQ